MDRALAREPEQGGVAGSAALRHRCAGDARAIFHEVRRHWLASDVCGKELYAVAQRASARLGWQVHLELSGHRLDQPAAALAGCRPASQQWRLEVHLHHLQHDDGACYAGILQDEAALPGIS